MAVINELNGIICVNKPEGFTSFDVIAKMRGILKMKRLGHGGTLDPMATGVLPVFAGSAAKASEMLPDHDKVYEAGFRLGLVTDTQDITGKTLSESGLAVSRQALEDASGTFVGDIMQIPPMYSAVSVNGKRLYELARQGITVERKPRPITVYSLDILEYNEDERSGRLKISCSKGTYIRTLINDIGERLGCGGIMTSLVRTAACGFSLSDCVTIEQLQQEADRGGDFSSFVMPVSEVFDYLPKVRLSDAQERMYRNGIRLDFDRICKDTPDGERYAVFGASGFIGTAVLMPEERLLRVEKNFF
ncbi:MAG: tRNA pseudouridine(55) synthase TruB [Oscillospiraceae bacterium]|nr:tRNA pseudouridine(55) synthase TruB [Oscillospiraceae bacterium]